VFQSGQLKDSVVSLAVLQDSETLGVTIVGTYDFDGVVLFRFDNTKTMTEISLTKDFTDFDKMNKTYQVVALTNYRPEYNMFAVASHGGLFWMYLDEKPAVQLFK